MENEIETHIVLLNCQAMSTLDKPKHALKLLQQAEHLLQSEESSLKSLKNRQNLLAVTLNNLACYYKSVKQPNVSLSYLQKVLKIEIENFSEPSDLAATYLNICAIFSQLGKHQQAISSCFSAIKYLKGYENEENFTEKILNSLVVANYNLGVEYEYLQKFNKALEFYSQGLSLAYDGLGSSNSLTIKLKDSIENLNKHTNSLNSFINSRRELRQQRKIASSSLGPIKTAPKEKDFNLKCYKETHLPKIYNKAQRKLSVDLNSSQHEVIENRELTINKYSGLRKFSNAIDRLKNLIN